MLRLLALTSVTVLHGAAKIKGLQDTGMETHRTDFTKISFKFLLHSYLIYYLKLYKIEIVVSLTKFVIHRTVFCGHVIRLGRGGLG